MEKVMCIKCGSIGYTASPDQVPCSECEGRHKVMRLGREAFRKVRRYRILSLLGIVWG